MKCARHEQSLIKTRVGLQFSLALQLLIGCALAWLVATPSRSELPASAPDQAPGIDVQAILLRATIVTCKLEESLAFYRDVLGQRVIQQRDFSAEVGGAFVDVSPAGTVRLVIMEGRGEYSGGPVMGGRVALIAAVNDPKGPACRDSADRKNRIGHHGDLILPFRVSGIDEIARRAKARGDKIAFGPSPSPMGLSTNMLLWDPNGVLLELFEQRVQPLRDPVPGARETIPLR